MSDKDKVNFQCPFCSSLVNVEKEWASKNGMVFCPTCCKSFNVEVEEESDFFNVYDHVNGEFYD